MSFPDQKKIGWTRRQVLRVVVAAPVLSTIPGLSLGADKKLPPRVSLEDISYGFRFVKKGNRVYYWVRAVSMRQQDQAIPVKVVFGTATVGAGSAGLNVDQASTVYEGKATLTKAKGYSARGGFMTSMKRFKLNKGQKVYCQVLFSSDTFSSNVLTFKV
jgi:hypothetical protein